MIPRTLLLVCFAALAAWGCAPPVRTPQTLAPQFETRGISRIVLAPVVFADLPLDRYHGVRAAEEIRWYAERALRSKGYEVTSLESPYTLNVPRAPKGADFPQLAPPVPAGADAVMVIRVDHFLDAGLYDRQVRGSLDIYATAALIAPGGEILWKDEGVGRGSALPSALDTYDLTQAPAFLADSLFATLPAFSPQQGISALRRE